LFAHDLFGKPVPTHPVAARGHAFPDYELIAWPRAGWQLLLNHLELFWRPWGLGLTTLKKQRCERIFGATPFLPPGSTC
jgi:hypothetical protein